MADNNENIVNFENMLYPIITYYSFDLNSTGTYLLEQKQLEVVKCNSANAKVPEFVSNYQLADYYCFDWSKENLTLGGYWDGSYVNYI